MVFAVLGLTAGVPIIGAPALGEESGNRVAVAMAAATVPGSMPGLPDEAAMVLAGTALLGVAAAVRRAA